MTKSTIVKKEARAREFFRASGAREIDVLLELLHPEAILELPYALPSMPKRLQGRSAIGKFLRATAEAFSSFEMIVDAVYSAECGGAVVVEHHSHGFVAVNNRVYKNIYVTVLKFDEGDAIVLWKEYFDPGVVLRAFG